MMAITLSVAVSLDNLLVLILLDTKIRSSRLLIFYFYRIALIDLPYLDDLMLYYALYRKVDLVSFLEPPLIHQ